MSWLALALACAACRPAAVAPARPLDHAATPPTEPALHLRFADANAYDNDDHRELHFNVDHRLDATRIRIFEVTRGRIVDRPLSLIGEGFGADGNQWGYGVAMPEPESDQIYDDIVILAPTAGVTVAWLPPADQRALAAMKDASFAVVNDVRSHGLDLDGDKRADIAVLDVCLEVLQSDAMCAQSRALVVRRTPTGWQPTEFCAGPKDTNACLHK